MILCIVAIISIVYLDPILAVQLTSMGMNEDNVGFVFAIIGGAFGVGSPVSGWVCTRVNRTIVMQLAIVMLPFSILLCGPSAFLGLPDVIWIMMIGIFMLGWSAAFLFVPVTPEIIESTTIW
jgi:predicted MFS family arabinose efflux permease